MRSNPLTSFWTMPGQRAGTGGPGGQLPRPQGRRDAFRRIRCRRRGATAVLAMLYMVLFSSLAVGFYTATRTSVQISANEQRANAATMSAHSGLQFMKYHLGTLAIPAGTQQDQLFGQVYARLQAKLNNTANMPAGSPVIGMSADGQTILIPAAPDKWISLDDGGAAFQARVVKQTTGGQVQVQVFGRYGNYATAPTKGLALSFVNMPNPAQIFNFGVVSKSKISMNGNVSISGRKGFEYMGSVLSTYADDPVALTMIGTPSISGHVSFSNPNAKPSLDSNATIGTPAMRPTDPLFMDPQNGVVHKGVAAPEFPTVDTSVFKPFATTTYTSSMGTNGITLKNVTLPPGSYNFNNVTIQGVLYIKQPAQVRFGGQSTIKGVVVADGVKSGDASTNTITFKSVDAYPIDSSDTVLGTTLPAAEKALTGSLVLAPNFSVSFGGNFKTVSGSIIASKVDFSGNAGGTVKGSVINLDNTAVTLSGTSDIIIESQGTTNHPAGVYFGSYYSPQPSTYKELTQ